MIESLLKFSFASLGIGLPLLFLCACIVGAWKERNK